MTAIDIEAARALLARVETATEASRDLDAAIDVALDLRPTWARDIAEKPVGISAFSSVFGPFGHVRAGKSGPGWDAGAYTFSQDAATTLIQIVFPDCSWGVSVEPPTPHGALLYHAYVGDHYPHRGAPPGKWWGESSYKEGAALALCEALLKAVIAKAEAGDRA